jgi:hypothetical protein
MDQNSIHEAARDAETLAATLQTINDLWTLAPTADELRERTAAALELAEAIHKVGEDAAEAAKRVTGVFCVDELSQVLDRFTELNAAMREQVAISTRLAGLIGRPLPRKLGSG